MLVMEPRLLVLDEPTSQLDPVGKKEVFTLLDQLAKEGEMTVVIIEHELEWIGNFAERVIVMHEGRVVEDGKPEQVIPKMMGQRAGPARPPQGNPSMKPFQRGPGHVI